MKKKIILLGVVLFSTTGCLFSVEKESNFIPFSYEGEELIYKCTADDLDLFKEDVEVVVSSKQLFVIEEDKETKTLSKGKHEFESDEHDVKSCYFVSTEELTDNKFGTPTPVFFKDAKLGNIELAMYGTYSYRIVDPLKFLSPDKDIDLIKNGFDQQLSFMITTRWSNMIGDYSTIVDVQSKFDNKELINKVNEDIKDYGLEVTEITIESVSSK